MWFALGSITLLGFAWLFMRWRLASRWKGNRAQWDALTYEFLLRKHKSKVQRILMGVACDTALEFCLQEETFVDRVFKSLGLSREQQLDRLHFDEKVYIVSDDPRLGLLLKYNNALPALLESLFEEGRFAHGRVRKLWCQQRRLWVECVPAGDFAEGDIALLAKEILPVLQTLRDALLSKAPAQAESRDHFIFKAALLLGVSTALAVNGAVHGFRFVWSKFPVVIDNADVWQMAAWVGGGLAAALVTLCVVLLGRTSRAHLVLIELLTIGAVGCVLTAYVELRDYNIEFDTQPVSVVNVQVDRYYTTRCGKRNRSTCYHVQLAPFSGVPKGLKLDVDRTLYQQWQGQRELRVPLHAGALGWRWIDAPQRL